LLSFIVWTESFIARDDEDTGRSINYHAVMTKTKPEDEEISQPDATFLDFGKNSLDRKTYNYVDRVMMGLYDGPNSEAAERREKARQKHGLQSIWIVYVHVSHHL
jgi:hypothetical protein